jgi:hypothetical protein
MDFKKIRNKNTLRILTVFIWKFDIIWTVLKMFLKIHKQNLKSFYKNCAWKCDYDSLNK